MRPALLSAAQVRNDPTRIEDHDGRCYVQVNAMDRRRLSLPNTTRWFWCARAVRGAPPRIGAVVHNMIIHTVALGFERTRAVGVVGLR